MTKEDKKYLLETLEYGLHGCIDVNGDSQTHFNSFANAIEIVNNLDIPVVVRQGKNLSDETMKEVKETTKYFKKIYDSLERKEFKDHPEIKDGDIVIDGEKAWVCKQDHDE